MQVDGGYGYVIRLDGDTLISQPYVPAVGHRRPFRTEAEAQLYEHQTRELNFRISSLESCDPSELFTTEVRDIIRNTLKELPEQTRLIFVKSRFENKTNREIAEELDTHIKTIEYHIAKALKLFRVRLKDYLPLLAFLGLSF